MTVETQHLRPKKHICVSAKPTDPVSCVATLHFYALPEKKKKKKKKKIFMPTDQNIFQKIGQTPFKMSELQT